MADVKMKGMVTGLTLDSGVNDLAVKFHIALEVSERQVVRSSMGGNELTNIMLRRPLLCKRGTFSTK